MKIRELKSTLKKEIIKWIPDVIPIDIPEIQISYSIKDNGEELYSVKVYDIDSQSKTETRHGEPNKLLRDVFTQNTSRINVLSTSIWAMTTEHPLELDRYRIESLTEDMINGDNIADWYWGYFIRWQYRSHHYYPEAILKIAEKTKEMQKNIPIQNKGLLEPLAVRVDKQIQFRKEVFEYNLQKLQALEKDYNAESEEIERLQKEIERESILLSGEPGFFPPYNGRTLEEYLTDDLTAFLTTNRRNNEQGEYYGPYAVFNAYEPITASENCSITGVSFRRYNDFLNLAIKRAKEKRLRIEKCIECGNIVLATPREYGVVACPECRNKIKRQKNALAKAYERKTNPTERVYDRTLKYINRQINNATDPNTKKTLEELKQEFCNSLSSAKSNFNKYMNETKDIRLKIYEAVTSSEEEER